MMQNYLKIIMNKIARPRLIVNTKSISNKTSDILPKGKKSIDPRIQKLNTILGPRGIRADEFLSKFDALTSKFDEDTPFPVMLEIQIDSNGRSISYDLKIGMISTSYLIKKKLNIEKLSSKPNSKNPIKIVDKQFVLDILEEKIKFHDEKLINKNRLFSNLIGSLKSYGIKYIE